MGSHTSDVRCWGNWADVKVKFLESGSHLHISLLWSDLRTTELTYCPCAMRHTRQSKVWLGAGPRLK